MTIEGSFTIPFELCSQYGFDTEPLPDFIPSKFGTEIILRKGGQWVSELRLYNPGVGTTKLKWGQAFNNHPLIEYSVRQFLIEELKLKCTFHGYRLFADLIGNLSLNISLNETKTEAFVSNWIIEKAIESFELNQALYSCIVNYANFCVEEEYWGFSERLLWQLSATRLPKRLSKSKKFLDSMLDPVQGPYNQQEIVAITNALAKENITIKDRALILLCRDLAPRPIQLALLQETDFISDIRGDYLRVPRVKGFKRSALRRTKNNHTERPLTEEIASDLKSLIASNQAVFELLDAYLEEYCRIHKIPFIAPPRPLFPRIACSEGMIALYLDGKSRAYTYHSITSKVSKHIRNLSQNLQVSRPGNTETDFLEIGSYRFRRTKATSMAIQGYTPEDVAYALDHSSISSVKHYFRFSRDLIDFVNLAASSSIEMNQMVSAWTGRFAEAREPGAKEIRLNQIDSLGICLNTEICEFHPTVTCYACPKFRAYKDANHRNALINIITVKDALETDSSGPVKGQLDVAIAMARECIKAQDRDLDNE